MHAVATLDYHEVLGQNDVWARFAVIVYDNSRRQLVFYARRWNRPTSSHICQLHLQGIFVHNKIVFKRTRSLPNASLQLTVKSV